MDVTDVRRVLKEQRHSSPKKTTPAAKPSDDSQIEFRPLHSGLGFHPPQRESVPTPRREGSDIHSKVQALAALRAQSEEFTSSLPVMPPQPMRSKPPKPVFEEPADEAPSETATALEPQSFGFDYLGRRLLAFVSDVIFQSVVLGSGLWVLSTQMNLDLAVFLREDLRFSLILGAVVMNWLLLTLQDLAFRASIGKEVFGLRLTGSSPRILLRALLLPLAMLTGFGLFDGSFFILALRLCTTG